MIKKSVVFLFLLFFFTQAITETKPLNLLPPGEAVASAHPLATNAGLEILAAGGNAFDAAIAVSAVLGVVAPYHSGLGGGGFWLLHEAKTQQNVLIDGREVAPKAATANMFLDLYGRAIPGASLNGGLAAAIPGEPAALVYLAKHYGRLSLSQSLAPAIKLAEEGFIVDPQFQYFSSMPDRLPELKRFPDTAAVFLKKDLPYAVGERLYQPHLANTLKLLASKGHDGFYKGEVAKNLVIGVRQNGGIWTEEDLENYKIKIRKPLQATYGDMTVITAPLPAAGGVGLITMLNILAEFDLASMNKVTWIHYVTEAMRLSFWQRGDYLSDPDFAKTPLEWLLSKENAKQLSAMILPNQALSSVELSKIQTPIMSPEKHTTHVSILDSEGNRVSATMTVNYIFGSAVVAEGTGVLLNDEMDDFSVKVGEKNVFGIPGSVLNEIAPGKRPLSNMAPAFFEMPGRLAIVGTPGGSRIPTMMLLAALNFAEDGGALSMVSNMRFHHQYLPDQLQFEPDTFSPALQNQLREMGYSLSALKQYFGDMQAISWDQKLNFLTAVSDPRHIGLATVILKTNQDGYGIKH